MTAGELRAEARPVLDPLILRSREGGNSVPQSDLLGALQRAEHRRGPARWWRDARRRRMLATADFAATLIAAAVLVVAVSGGAWALALAPVSIVLAKLFGLYDRDQMEIRHLTVDEMPSIAAWAGTTAVMFAGLLPMTPGGGHVGAGDLVLAAVALTVSAGLLRASARVIWRLMTPPELTVVVGNGELGRSVRRKVELFGDMHLRLLEMDDLRLPALNGNGHANGHIHLNGNGHANGNGAHANGNGSEVHANGNGDDPARPTVETLRCLATQVDRIIIASELIEPSWIGEVAALCREHQVKLSVVSPLRGKAGAAPRLSEVADLPVLEYDTRDISRSTRLLKRAFDLTAAGVLLVAFAPLLPLIALAIKLDSAGPVFFVQTRAGFHGRPFRMLKFRTMHQGADALLGSLIEMQTLRDQPAFKIQRDPRVTRVGRVLRRLSLDEVPQLVNVLRGEMSIVGPRPEQIDLVRLYRPEHRFRLSVKPGLTGPMQVFGRGALTFSERLAVELDYVENLSLTRDVRMLAQTIPAVIRGTGAY